jgi:hypothetical protein
LFLQYANVHPDSNHHHDSHIVTDLYPQPNVNGNLYAEPNGYRNLQPDGNGHQHSNV